MLTLSKCVCYMDEVLNVDSSSATIKTRVCSHGVVISRGLKTRLKKSVVATTQHCNVMSLQLLYCGAAPGEVWWGVEATIQQTRTCPHLTLLIVLSTQECSSARPLASRFFLLPPPHSLV